MIEMFRSFCVVFTCLCFGAVIYGVLIHVLIHLYDSICDFLNRR